MGRASPIVLIAEPRSEREAALRLGRIGFDHVAGYLDGGMQALDGRPELIRRLVRTTAATLAEQLASSARPTVLDVRTDREWQEKHIEGSVNIPLGHLKDAIQQIPTDAPVVVHCASGYRSSIAASLLEREGVNNVADLVGGIAAWETSQLPTTPYASMNGSSL